MHLRTICTALLVAGARAHRSFGPQIRLAVSAESSSGGLYADSSSLDLDSSSFDDALDFDSSIHPLSRQLLGAHPSADPSRLAKGNSLLGQAASNSTSIKSPRILPMASSIYSNLVSRVGESFNISVPESIRRGTVTNCDGDMAYTFDDGPYLWHDEINALFQKHDAKTTMFVNGLNYGCIYAEDNVKSLRASYDAGHLIASHTWGHVHLNQLTPAQIDLQMDLVEEALWKILGVVPAIMRPPYGEADEAVVRQLNARGYTVVTWSDDSGDSTGGEPPSSITEMEAFQYPSPHIALNHETHQPSVEVVVPAVLPVLKQHGYNLVTVAQCLKNVSPYKIQGKRQERDATWTCDGKPLAGAAQ